MPSASTAVAPLEVAVPADPAARIAFSRRDRGAGNVSLRVGAEPGRPGAPLAARARLAAAVGLEPGDVVWAAQVHGAGVARVSRADAGRGAGEAATAVPGVDALVTTDAGLGLAVLAADCVPLLLVDPGRGVAAVHAGRTGTEAGVVTAALAALLEATGGRSAPGRVEAVLGPAIGGCCYEVPADLAGRVGAAVPGTRATTRWGTPSLDLPAGVAGQLAAAGVTRVRFAGPCTLCGEGAWFSARGAAAGRVPAGRHAGIVCRLPIGGRP